MPITKEENILEFDNVTVAYDSSIAIDNISLTISRGDFIGLAGPNGAGKTTLVKAALGLHPLKKGSINLFGQNIAQFSKWQKIGYLPQKQSSVNPLLPASVEEVVSLGLLSTKGFPKLINNKDKNKISQILSDLDILKLKNKMFSSLSGGQQQRVVLARALVSEPELLIFDEPSNALDPDSRDSFFNIISKLNKEKGVAIILITHDTGYIGQYANKLLYIDKELIYFGSFAEFCESEKMSARFGKVDQHLICHQHNS
jgi:zinc transport system ATP-binding protein